MAIKRRKYGFEFHIPFTSRSVYIGLHSVGYNAGRDYEFKIHVFKTVDL